MYISAIYFRGNLSLLKWMSKGCAEEISSSVTLRKKEGSFLKVNDNSKNILYPMFSNLYLFNVRCECLPLYCWWLIMPIQNNAKVWNPGTWVLIWEYKARAIQWIPTWQLGYHSLSVSLSLPLYLCIPPSFPKKLCILVLHWSSLSIGQVGN